MMNLSPRRHVTVARHLVVTAQGGHEWARVHCVSRMPVWAGQRTAWGRLVGSVLCVLSIGLQLSVLVTSAFTC